MEAGRAAVFRLGHAIRVGQARAPRSRFVGCGPPTTSAASSAHARSIAVASSSMAGRVDRQPAGAGGGAATAARAETWACGNGTASVWTTGGWRGGGGEGGGSLTSPRETARMGVGGGQDRLALSRPLSPLPPRSRRWVQAGWVRGGGGVVGGTFNRLAGGGVEGR